MKSIFSQKCRMVPASPDFNVHVGAMAAFHGTDANELNQDLP